MANRSCRCKPIPKLPAAPVAESRSAPPEPVMRRWPHPVEGLTPPAVPQPDPMLHYIRCALTYQNELLSEIKALLEELAASREER